MASEPIDTSSRPNMRSVQCQDGCGEWLVIDGAYTGKAYCSACLANRIGLNHAVTEPPPAWFSANNPPPPSAVYPPRVDTGTHTPVRVADPNLTGYCIQHRKPVPMVIHGLNPDDITVAFAAHDRTWHTPGAWLLGATGGAGDDICRACGGAYWDKEAGREMPLTDGPRHDLCLKGKTRGRGGNCPCTHDRPWMKGVKPTNLDVPGAVRRTQEILAAHRPPDEPEPPKPTPPPVAMFGLFDPDDEENPDA